MQAFDKIIILWKGLIQARVTDQSKDFWLDTLEVGACIGVYSAWSKEKTSLLDYIAFSKCVVVQMISVSELQKLSTKIIPLADRIKRMKLRVNNDEVDDIDYFTFPKQ